jgi:hypothetical protein
MGVSDWIAIAVLGAGAIMGTLGHRAIRLIGGALILAALLGLGIGHYHNVELPPPVPPRPPTPHLRSDEPKQYTERTARELATLFVGRTPLQASKLIESDVSKWLKVFGEVKMIWRSNSEGDVGLILSDGPASIQCAFGSQWADYFTKINQGDVISVEGQILDSQIGSPLYLTKCEVD